MARRNRGLQAVRDRTSTVPPSRCSKCETRLMKPSKPGGRANSTRKSQSLSSRESLRAREPKSQARVTPKRCQSPRNDSTCPVGGATSISADYPKTSRIAQSPSVRRLLVIEPSAESMSRLSSALHCRYRSRSAVRNRPFPLRNPAAANIRVRHGGFNDTRLLDAQRQQYSRRLTHGRRCRGFGSRRRAAPMLPPFERLCSWSKWVFSQKANCAADSLSHLGRQPRQILLRGTSENDDPLHASI